MDNAGQLAKRLDDVAKIFLVSAAAVTTVGLIMAWMNPAVPVTAYDGVTQLVMAFVGGFIVCKVAAPPLRTWAEQQDDQAGDDQSG